MFKRAVFSPAPKWFPSGHAFFVSLRKRENLAGCLVDIGWGRFICPLFQNQLGENLRRERVPYQPHPQKPVCRPVHWGAVVIDARMAKLIGLQMGFWSRNSRELIEENTDEYGKKRRETNLDLPRSCWNIGSINLASLASNTFGVAGESIGPIQVCSRVNVSSNRIGNRLNVSQRVFNHGC